MSRDHESEIETLRRENDRLRQEVVRRREAGRARWLDEQFSSTSNREAPASTTNPETDTDQLAGRLEDAIAAMYVELTEKFSASIRSINCRLDKLSQEITQGPDRDDLELVQRLDQLSAEVQHLRREVVAVRRYERLGLDGDETRAERIQLADIVIEQDRKPRTAGITEERLSGRPGFYLPLVWGIVVLVVVLGALLIWW